MLLQHAQENNRSSKSGRWAADGIRVLCKACRIFSTPHKLDEIALYRNPWSNEHPHRAASSRTHPQENMTNIEHPTLLLPPPLRP